MCPVQTSSVINTESSRFSAESPVWMINTMPVSTPGNGDTNACWTSMTPPTQSNQAVTLLQTSQYQSCTHMKSLFYTFFLFLQRKYWSQQRKILFHVYSFIIAQISFERFQLLVSCAAAQRRCQHDEQSLEEHGTLKSRGK